MGGAMFLRFKDVIILGLAFPAVAFAGETTWYDVSTELGWPQQGVQLTGYGGRLGASRTLFGPFRLAGDATFLVLSPHPYGKYLRVHMLPQPVVMVTALLGPEIAVIHGDSGPFVQEQLGLAYLDWGSLGPRVNDASGEPRPVAALTAGIRRIPGIGINPRATFRETLFLDGRRPRVTSVSLGLNF